MGQQNSWRQRINCLGKFVLLRLCCCVSCQSVLPGAFAVPINTSRCNLSQFVFFQQPNGCICQCGERMSSKPQDMLHPQGIVSYNKDAGFKIKVERLYNCKKKSAWKQINKVIYCTNPPGGWYSDPKLLDDVYFTTRHDWKSGKCLQTWCHFHLCV